MAPPRVPLEERFWDKVYPDPNTGCWLWGGAGKPPYGYGLLLRGGRGSKHDLASRVAYELLIGPIPAGLFVLHKCDVPACVNPEHLYAGTQYENVRDREVRGRSADVRGEANPAAKLREGDVLAIRAARPRGVLFQVLAARYGVSDMAIRMAAKRQTWRHLP